jgi:protein-ribulosamine 3-kinase
MNRHGGAGAALPPVLRDWCQAEGLGAVVAQQALAGGCINAVSRLTTASGRTVVLKRLDAPPAGFTAGEAAGLRSLAVAAGPRIPAVLFETAELLVLEDLGAGEPGPRHWQDLGHALAALHAAPASTFGFPCTTFLGRTPLDNTSADDGWLFFAERRLLALARQALPTEAGLRAGIGSIAARLRELVPEQAPALLHGDLWSGNLHACAGGGIALIDPAAYCGWPEADLAMTTLFGGVPATLLAAYQERRPLAPGYAARIDLYNLVHLLNHLLLFGASYAPAVARSIARYR